MSPVGTTALNVVIDGVMPSGAGDPPELLSFDYSIGGFTAAMTVVYWQPIGRVRFKCVGTGVDDHQGLWRHAFTKRGIDHTFLNGRYLNQELVNKGFAKAV